MRIVERPIPAVSSARGLWLTLIALLALTAISYCADQPPTALSMDAPAEVFSAGRAAGLLGELLGSGTPHPLASAADERIRQLLLQRLRALGVATELQEGWACDVVLACGRVVNIIGHIDGTEPAGGGVLLAAHYDSVPAGPGAGDDGVGMASVLEIARVLKQQPARRHPITLLIDEGEEAGLLGARLFVAGRPEARTIRAAVNLDARGDSGPSLMFETGAATNWALKLFADAVERPMSNSLYYFVYKLLPNDTDFTVFKAAGYQGFNFALIGDVERYHTPQDRLENLDLRSLQHQGQNALSMVQALAAADLRSPPAAGAVFFDLYSRALWHWPASWSLGLGLALSVALGATLWTINRRRGRAAAPIVYGLAALATGWAGAVLLSAVLLTLARAVGAVPPAAAYSWAAFPAGMHAASVALALLAPAWASKLFRGRTDAWGLWFAALTLQAVLALLCAWKAPEVSYLFFSPVIAGLIAALGIKYIPAGPGATTPPPWAVALPVLGTAFTFIPIVLLLYPALGADAWPLITALSGLLALGLAPLLAAAPPPGDRLYAGLAALIVIIGGATTLLVPEYSRSMPQRTLLWYQLDADAGRAAWLLQPDSKRLPPQLALNVTRQAQPTVLPTGNIERAVAAAAPRLDYPAPVLQVVSIESRGSQVFYHLHVRSPRNAPEIELGVADDRPVAATLDEGPDHKLPAHFWRTADGSRWLQLIGAPPAGIDLTLETSSADDVALTVLDRSYGVPPAAGAPRRAASALTTPSQDGDLTIVYRALRLSAAQSATGS